MSSVHKIPGRPEQWGRPEYAIAGAIFCLPAVMAFAGGAVSHAVLAIGAALVVTIAARGAAGGQRFLAAGIIVSCIWYFGGGIAGASERLDVYVWILPLTLVAHYNLVPFTLRGAIALPAARRPMIALVVSVMLMNMTPAAFLLARWVAGPRWPFVLALVWLVAAISATGSCATIVAARMRPGSGGQLGEAGS